LDFLDKLLRYDHQSRLTAREAMEHPYFCESVCRLSHHCSADNHEAGENICCEESAETRVLESKVVIHLL
jgi:serine/threonine protein kinase